MKRITPEQRVQDFFRAATTPEAQAMLKWIDGFLAGRGVQPEPPAKRERKKRTPYPLDAQQSQVEKI